MRNLSFNAKKWDKRYFWAFIITFVCSVVCGIILYKPVTANVYFINLTDEYVFNVFNFKNSTLFFTRFLCDVLYFYVFFLICCFTKIKYLTLVFLYIRGLFFAIYAVILFSVCAVSGILAAIFIFIPSTLISIAFCFVISETCKCGDKRFALLIPLIFALIDGIILLLLINVLFRVVIIIV